MKETKKYRLDKPFSGNHDNYEECGKNYKN